LIFHLLHGIASFHLRLEIAKKFFCNPILPAGEHKIIMKVRSRWIPFESEREWKVFRQIVRKRYDPKKKELKLVSDQFASRIENKKHLISMLNRIILESKRLAKEAENLELVP